jgi:TatD DNase family protein
MPETLPSSPKWNFSPGLYDVHAHLADLRLQATLPQILLRCATELQAVLVNAAKVSEWDTVLELSENPGIYAALGVHPFYLKERPQDCFHQLRKKLLHPPQNSKVLAIGEIGLDFWNGRDDAEDQLAALSEQLLIAQQLQLPVILHNRKAWPDFFALLKRLRITTLRGVCHHFNASAEIARQALDYGLFLSFCGPLTWPESKRLHKLAATVPLDRILVETDCPDLPPQSCRGAESRPWMVAEIMGTIAGLRKISMEKLAEQIAANWTTLFCQTCKQTTLKVL